MGARSWAAVAALAVGIWALPARAQTVVDFSLPLSSYTDFTTTGYYAGGYITNYNPTGTFATGFTNYLLQITFLVPISDLSFEYNHFGIYAPIRLGSTDLPIGATSPLHPSGWFSYAFPTGGPPGTAQLNFFSAGINIGFGIDNLRYTRAEILAVPGPMAGAGLPALVAFVFLWRRRQRTKNETHGFHT